MKAEDINWTFLIASGNIKRSFDHVQHLFMAMADATRFQGKRGFFGADKGEKHFNKFVDLLIPQLKIMHQEGLISYSDDPDDICDKIHMMNTFFYTAFPNWPDALQFSTSFFVENRVIASKIVGQQLGKLFGWSTFTDSDGSIYVGEGKDNKRNGHGTLNWPNGSKYVGEWKDGKRNGQGTLTWIDGDKYVGEWKNDKRAGKGIFNRPNGNKYVGEYKGDKKNGHGTYTWPNGDKYVGEWKDDKMTGQGTLTMANGDTYVGEFKDDKYVGQRVIGTIDSGVYVGDFEDEAFAAYENADFATALKIWTPLAEQGDAAAQSNLGVLYHQGQGVTQDYNTAVKWYTRAAEQGDADAQSNLGIMFENGSGVLQDYVKAHMWYNIAAIDGSSKEAASNREDIAQKMTSAQIEKAQEAASRCIKKNFKNCD